MSRAPGTRCREITALLVPADDCRPVRLVRVEDRAQVYSELIGGGLLDETPLLLPDGQTVALYLDEDRVAVGLPRNPRAARLADRLHLRPRTPLELRGDLLVTGLGRGATDTDVPSAVLAAACSSGLIEPQHSDPPSGDGTGSG
ncbi:MAG TPA: hypothetical protein VFP72_19990 [Kineosporiaceae bacterium]|nr:hypothetical protein [Kineosporiaceae bacterium]